MRCFASHGAGVWCLPLSLSLSLFLFLFLQASVPRYQPLLIVFLLSLSLSLSLPSIRLNCVVECSYTSDSLSRTLAFEEFECVMAWLVHPSDTQLSVVAMDAAASSRLQNCVASLRALFVEMGRERARHVDFHLRSAGGEEGGDNGASSGGVEPFLDADYVGLAELLRHESDLRALGVVPPQLSGEEGGDGAATIAQRWSLMCCEWDPQMRDWRSALQHAEATHVAHSTAIQGGEMSWEEFSAVAAYCTPSEVAVGESDTDPIAPLDDSILLQSLSTFRQLRSDFAERVAALEA